MEATLNEKAGIRLDPGYFHRLARLSKMRARSTARPAGSVRVVASIRLRVM